MDEAKSILLNASEFTGWEVEDMLDVVCDYINEHIGTDGLERYVKELVGEEIEEDKYIQSLRGN